MEFLLSPLYSLAPGPVIKAVVTFGGSSIESAAIPFRRVPVFRDPGLRLRQKEKTMAKKITKKKKSGKPTSALPVMRSNAAGIDIGATEIYVAVPADRDAEPVRSFPTLYAGPLRTG